MRFWVLMRSDGKLRRAGLIVVIGALLSACAARGYEPSGVRRHLVDAGVNPRAADCVVLHMGPRFGDERLGARAEPSAKEIDAMRVLLRTCGVAVSS